MFIAAAYSAPEASQHIASLCQHDAVEQGGFIEPRIRKLLLNGEFDQMSVED